MKQAIQASWPDEVHAIDKKQVTNFELLTKLKSNLLTISPAFAAVGHGFCLRFQR